MRAELPYWLFLALEQQYEDAGPLLAALTEPAPLDLRVNLIKASRDDVLAELSAHAVGATASRYSPEAIRLTSKPALTQLAGLSRRSHRSAGRGQPADRAAAAAATRRNGGRLLRRRRRQDTGARRADAIERAPVRVRYQRAPARRPWAAAQAQRTVERASGRDSQRDRRTSQAPARQVRPRSGRRAMLGTGTLRRNPDLKWRFDETELARVNEVQHAVLRGCGAAAQARRPPRLRDLFAARAREPTGRRALPRGPSRVLGSCLHSRSWRRSRS